MEIICYEEKKENLEGNYEEVKFKENDFLINEISNKLPEDI